MPVVVIIAKRCIVMSHSRASLILQVAYRERPNAVKECVVPCLIRILEGDSLTPVDYQAGSLAEAAQFEPHDGVYTIANTFDGTQVLLFDAHLDRMERSAERSGMALTLDRPRLRRALRTMIAEADYGEVRYRITAPTTMPSQLILSIEPFRPLAPAVYAEGVRVVTLAGAARETPEAKTAGWLHDRAALEHALPPGIFTGLLIGPHGELLEGLSTNFYAVLDGVLRTAGEGVLPGMAQVIVLAIAPEVLPVEMRAVLLEDVPHLQEAFITSASRGIVPVVTIDGHTIGDGTPGPRTRALRERYAAWAAAHLQAL
jgi:branched-chain amino acid aminotransferase